MSDEKSTQTMPVVTEVVQRIAEALGETAAIPISQIGRIIEVLGEEKTLDLLAQTETIQTQGGMDVSSGSRQRSKGGVFFYLARQALDSSGRKQVWATKSKAGSKKSGGAKSSGPALEWPARLNLIAQVRKSPGEARTAKMTLVGRPARVVVKGEVVLVSMPPSDKQPSLPRELPVPPAETAGPTLVYIAIKQWHKVEGALKDPKDRLIVEGYPAIEGRINALTLYATNITTAGLQRAKRAQ